MRTYKTRRSDVVVRYGQDLLKSAGSLGDEVWTVYEQVCVAAVDCHNYELAESCLEKLSRRLQRATTRWLFMRCARLLATSHRGILCRWPRPSAAWRV